MTAEKKKDEAEKVPTPQQDTSKFRINIPIGKEFSNWVAKLFALVLAVVLTFLFVIPLKWALGINAIEDYLNTIQSNLTATEDTIFSYKYDFYVPDFNAENIIIMNANSKANDISDISTKIVPEDFFSSKFDKISDFRTLFSDDDWKTLLRSRGRLQSPVKRVFYFSAAPEAEVTLDYELGCFTSDGYKYTKPVTFTVDVNNHEISKSSDWRGRQTLDKQLDDNFDAIPTNKSDYSLRKHTLTLNLFKHSGSQIDEFTQRETMKAIVSGNIERCAFDAMIFVRDLPAHFKQRDMITWIRERTSL